MGSFIPIGIDLGALSSRTACLKRKIEIISGNIKDKSTPIVVYFADDYLKIGDRNEEEYFKTKNFIFGFQKLIGLNYNDFGVQKLITTLGNNYYKIVNLKGKPGISILIDGEEKIFEPEVIVSLFLYKLKQDAMHCSNAAVLTVPSYFNTCQRQSFNKAAKFAGLKVLQILNKSTACAIAYAYESIDSDEGKKNILIYNLDTDYFDVAIVSVEGNEFTVLAREGDENLTGENIDDRLFNFIIEQFQSLYLENVLEGDPTEIKKLSKQVKHIRVSLLKNKSTKVSFNNYKVEITIDQYNEICSNIFQSTINIVDKVLDDTRIQKLDIDNIVLIGEYGRTPGIKKLLSEVFPNQSLCMDINSEEAAVTGAAILASVLTNSPYANEFKGFKLNELPPTAPQVATQVNNNTSQF
ncbi:uncharacterized protein SAPINGB_P002691 [Magnusiomyces paraingens]|uniref:Uncharacterized protein n=1 Tax=Magnusiomyces paraingens TaxID=2606893 RepID=A0A5E8BLA9_9ASCO|nr:uncharacterized protein SAPINGB_P002691 [Saprochaete ingens]VVT50285.1 unnamed protein product [Saprochaete ingens]